MIFGKRKSMRDPQPSFDLFKMRSDLSYARQYYADHPGQIEQIMENSPLFYSYMCENWKDQWYCCKCRRWLPVKTKQCSCGAWQNESLRKESVLQTSNKRIDDCFTLLQDSLKIPPLPRLRICEGEFYESLLDAEEDAERTACLIKEVVQKILRHLDVPPTSVTTIVKTVQDNDPSSTAGQYITGNQNLILINIRPKYHVDTNVSIACHECIHHYLSSNGIWLQDEKENEFLTDIAIVYCGMIGSIGIGYYEYSQKAPRPGAPASKYKIGYISQKEIDYAICLYMDKRNQYVAEQQALLNERIDVLEKSIEYNKALFSRVLSSAPGGSLSPDELELLSKNAAFVQFEEGKDWLAVSKQWVSLIDIDNASDCGIKKYHKQLNDYCAQLSRYNRLLNQLI